MNAFTPFPGFDPMEGDDRVTLSRDNPCAPRHSPAPYEPSREDLLSVSQAEAEARGWI